MAVYRKLNRARVRMVLEAIEDHWRGWIPGQKSAAGMRIRRASYAIEHIMPQSWAKHWPLRPDGSEQERDARLHRLGNLTLLTATLNSTVSNGPWLGKGGKASHLQDQDVVLLNRRVLKGYEGKQWDEAGIDQRTREVIDAIITIWPVPVGHKVQIDRQVTDGSVTVEIGDLVGAGYLAPGQTLYSSPGKHGGFTGKALSDGRIEVRDRIFETPSSAGMSVRKKPTNGWTFWRLELSGKRSLADVRSEYLRVVSPGEVEREDAEAPD